MKKYLKIMMFAIALYGGFYAGIALAGRYKADNVHMLATVLWHEIRGGTMTEIKQVANVIMNRLDMFEKGNKEGYQLELGDILTAKAQFSGSETYLNANMTNADILKHINMRGSEGTAWKNCLNVATQALAGQLPDLTHGATHYRTCTGPNMTFWGASKIQGVTHGKHCFFRGIAMGSMKVNGHVFRQGIVTGKYSNGTASVEVGGDGSGEGNYFGDGYASSYGGAAGSFVDLTFDDEEYIKKCEQAIKENSTEKQERVAPNLFNTQILDRMAEMLKSINKSLGKIYVIGRTLMCHASNDGQIDLYIFKMINIPYWLAGAAIYISAFFITLSIGLFFVDVALKIGFALLMLPISIALWPFEPTRGKLSENFSIIIRNAMLLTLVSIGVAYGITLIESSVIYAINDIDFNKAVSELSAVNMAKQFAFSGLNCLIIGFCLIYAYLLVQSSVNDYLDRIFPDNVFGQDSSVHHRAVQAFGNAATHTVLPLAAIGSDVIRTKLGRGLVSMGEGLKNISQRRGPENPTAPTPIAPQPAPTTPSLSENNALDTPETENAHAQNEDLNNENDRKKQSNRQQYLNKINNRQNKRNRTLADVRKEKQNIKADSENKNLSPQNTVPNQSPVESNGVKADNSAAKNSARSALDAFKIGMQNADAAAFSLSAGTILKNAGKAANAPFELLNKRTWTQLAHLDELRAKQAQKEAARRQAEDALIPGMTKTERVIMRGGQLFMRTAKDTRNEASYAAGSILSGLGNAIKPSENKESWSERWKKWQYEKEQEEIEKQERERVEATLADQFREKN